MIIYAVEHIGLLSQLLSIRLAKHQDEKAVLFCVGLNQKPNLLKCLNESGFFDHIINFSSVGLYGQSEIEIEREIKGTYDALLKKEKLEICEIKRAYVGYDSKLSSAIYLDLNNIPFSTVAMSDTRGKAMHPSGWYLKCVDEIGHYNSAYYHLACKVAPLTNSLIATHPFLVSNTSPLVIKEDHDPLIQATDFNAMMDNLPFKDRFKISTWFGENEEMLSHGFTLLIPSSVAHVNSRAYGMTQRNIGKKTNRDHFVNKLIYHDDEYEEMYAKALDYFSSDEMKVVIKPHPSNDLNQFENIKANGALLLSSEIPVEFLRTIPQISRIKPLTLKSTSISKLNGIIEDEVELSFYFLEAFGYTDRLWVILELNKSLFKMSTIKYIGINEKIFNLFKSQFDCPTRLVDKLSELRNPKSDCCYIINTSLLHPAAVKQRAKVVSFIESLPEDSVIFFMNALQDFPFIHLKNAKNVDVLDYLSVVNLTYYPIKTSPIGRGRKSQIVFFTKNSGIKKKINELKISKKLNFSGWQMEVDISSSKDLNAYKDDAILKARKILTIKEIFLNVPNRELKRQRTRIKELECELIRSKEQIMKLHNENKK